ncbi:MAG: insulinase family protein [Acidobacteriota bacterium]
MTSRIRVQLTLLAAAVVIATGLIGAQQPAVTSAVQTAALTQLVPVDTQITQGTLANGLRYYVRANRKPEQRAELRLVIKAGSVLEEDDQQGLAHFAEHMAFNGTLNFPKHALISFIESLGMRFGADLNASTGFDETIYMLQVPTERTEVLDRSFQILEDWAHNVTFDPAEIEKERGVIMEEWRLRRGAGARLTDRILPVLLNGSRYADRLPIGKTEIIQNFNAARVKQFYTDWYRPDLMAVVAVGDFDRIQVENQIKAHFSAIPAPPAPRPRPTYDVPARSGTSFAVMTDREITAASIEIDHILPARDQDTVGAYRERIVDRLFSGMLSARLAELAQKPDAPFLAAGAGRSLFLARTREQASLSARVKEDGIERGLEGLLGEAERVARFGFTVTELERQKQAVLRSYERVVAEVDNIVSSSRADEYVRNFTQNETLPSPNDEYAMHQRFVPQITLDEVNRMGREWFPDQNRLVIVSAPDKAGLVVPDEQKLAAVIKAAPGRELTAFVDTVSAAALLDAAPRPGRIARTTTIDAAGITEWQLSNGVKVVLKPTTFKEDEVIFRATSPGGTSLASDQDFIPASTATQLISAGGLGRFNAIDMRKILTGKAASATPFIGELEEGLNGGGSRKDLETLFQLIYLRFTQPRRDETAFAAQTTQMKSLLANQSASPDYALASTLAAAMYQNHVRRRPQTLDAINEWNLDKSLAFYKDRFADASDFTFVFVGSFDLATMKPLVERYLGALPSIRRKETWKDVGVRPASGIVEKTVEKGIEPKSQVAIMFNGPFEYDEMHRLTIRAMAHMLQGNLLQAIRENLGGTYSITASPTLQRIPRPEYLFAIRFGCDPQRTDGLLKRVFQEIEQFKLNGPSPQQVGDEKAALLREFETSSKQNNFLLGQIVAKYQNQEDVRSVWYAPELYRKLTAEMIQQAAREYLNVGNHVQVTLQPEKQ